MSNPKQPRAKSECIRQTDVVIRFAGNQSSLTFEKNVGQAAFTEPTEFLAISLDGDQWFMPKIDARKLRDWLTEAIK